MKAPIEPLTCLRSLLMLLCTIVLAPQTLCAQTETSTTTPLCFTAQEANATVQLTKTGVPTPITFQISTDGTHWTDYPIDATDGSQIITLAAVGDQVYFRNAADEPSERFSLSTDSCYKFVIANQVAASGNVMSLMDRSCTKSSLANADYAFYHLFYKCTSLTSAPALPATTLASKCYRAMFYGCTSLTSTPALPATTLANYCYFSMFYNCSSLTSAAALPATTLENNCYTYMFYNCTSLTSTPALPATTLTSECYRAMFYGCTSLTSAPALPATTLANDCYYNMFYGCTNLTSAPALPATTLANSCYRNMFYGCTNLTSAPALPATTLTSMCYRAMFYGCTNLTSAPALPATTLASDCYRSMFDKCTSLTSAPALPATTLANDCYFSMFYNCTSLTSAPALPATALENNCYSYMFYDCTSLTSAPALPATALENNCYSFMFYGCTSLTSAPALPATTLANECYRSMFNNCTRLTSAPALPATTLAKSCYRNMFHDCTRLTSAPALPAKALADSCYFYMFDGCSKLNNIVVGFSRTNGAKNPTKYWLRDVSKTGTFTAPCTYSGSTGTTSSVPSGWTLKKVHAYNDNAAAATADATTGLYDYVCDYGCGTIQQGYKILKGYTKDSNLKLLVNQDNTYTATQDIALTDDNQFANVSITFTSPSAPTYTHTMDNLWGSLVLPFDITVQSEAQPFALYTLREVKDQTLFLTRVQDGTLAAGTPVLVRIAAENVGQADNLSLTASDNVVNTTVKAGTSANGLTLSGVYQPTQANDSYIVANNSLWPAASLLSADNLWSDDASVDAKAQRTVFCPPFHAMIAGSTQIQAIRIEGDVTVEDVSQLASLILGGSWSAEQLDTYNSNSDLSLSVADLTFCIKRAAQALTLGVTTAASTPVASTNDSWGYVGIWGE